MYRKSSLAGRPQTAKISRTRKSVVSEHDNNEILNVTKKNKSTKKAKGQGRESRNLKSGTSAKSSKINFHPSEKSAEGPEEIEDEGILMLKIGKKGNEFRKPGQKKYKPNAASYTNEVLKRLDQIQNPKPPKVAKPKNAGKKKAKKTEAELELEGLELKGMEIIKDLDTFYEKNKATIKDKVIKSQKFRDFAKVRFDTEKADDFTKFKMEITKHILNDLGKYCLIK